MKMSKTRALLLEFASAGIAIGAALTLKRYGVPGFIIIPIGVIIAWYQMGLFLSMWKANKKQEV